MFAMRGIVFAALATMGAASASAGPVLDRVHAHGVVRCGSFDRPGLAIDVAETEAAEADSAGQEPSQTPWHGLNVEICRAVAMAVLGSPDKIAFHGYDDADDLATLTQGGDDIAFLSAQEMHMTGVTGRVVPGPVVYIESIAAMLPVATGVRHLQDMDATKGVCFANGSSPEHVLPAYFAAVKRPWRPIGYTEDGEMLDAYNVQQCQILSGERTTLAMDALEGGVNGLKSVILPEPIAAFPIMATTSDSDGRWSAIVAWTVYTLMAGDRPTTDWQIGGAASMPVPMTDVGLAPDWQAHLLAYFGSYGRILDRTVGIHSALTLPPGLNAGLDQGGILIAPSLQ
jgi:general L-amino acid transport system substrate-binding protein